MPGEYYLDGGLVAGWARDTSINRPLWVELLVDNEPVDLTLANLKEPDGCGFSMRVPPVMLEAGAEILVRIANSNEYLPFGSQSPPNFSRGIIGEIFLDRGLTVSGWAADSLDPEKILNISAWADGSRLAQTTAASRCFKPKEADGHSFVLHLPLALADGKKRSIRITDDTGRQLPGSPLKVCLIPQNSGDWLESCSEVATPARMLTANLLRNFEKRWPGVASPDDLPLWQKTFPLPKPQRQPKISLSAPYTQASTFKAMCNGQKAIEIKPQAFESGNAEFLLLMNPADTLHPEAMAHMLCAMRENSAELVYADGEDTNGHGLFRPSWDKWYFLDYDYAGPMLVSAKTAKQAQITAKDSLASMRLKLVLAAEAGGGIVHLPFILAKENGALPQTGRRHTLEMILHEHFPGATVEDSQNNSLSGLTPVHYPVVRFPRVTVIIPTRNRAEMLNRCLQSLFSTDWPDLEFIVVDNGSTEDSTLALLQTFSTRANCHVIHKPGEFNYADLNNAAASMATGELICLLNNDTEIQTRNWLCEMASLLLAPEANAGCVGAKLLWPQSLVQHGGVVVGTHQLAAHVGTQWLEDESGYMNSNQVTRQFSAVTAACLLTPRDLFLENGGFDNHAFPVAFNDVDYCMRIRQQKKRIFWTPHARLLHHESASRGKDESPAAKARAEREMRMFRNRWGDFQDPFYNPNLPLSFVTAPYYGLAVPPRARNAR